MPISARYGHDLGASRFFRAGHVWTPAQILEAVSLRIKTDNVTVRVAYIVGLIFIARQLPGGFGPGHFRANERSVRLDDFGHFIFDALEITRPNRLPQNYLIAKTRPHSR